MHILLHMPYLGKLESDSDYDGNAIETIEVENFSLLLD